MTDEIEVDNYRRDAYKVRSTKLTVNNRHIQHMRLDIGDGQTESIVTDSNRLPVSGTLTPATPSSLTASTPTFATIGTSSGVVIAANASRKGLVITNDHATNILYLAIGTAAVVGRGIRLNAAGGVWEMDQYTFTTAEIRAIATGASTNVAIQELV